VSRKTRTRVVVRGALACVLLAACGGSDPPALQSTTEFPRPQGAPDIVLLTVSGHDGSLSGLFCTSESNRSYLGDPGEATDTLVRTLDGLGFTGQVDHYADFFDGIDADGDGVTDNPEQQGFLQLVAQLQAVYDNWILGIDNPTRIVIVAHSHGTVWAHMAASVMSHVPIDYLITLDGICYLWECEHEMAVAGWIAANGNPAPWDLSTPCDRWPIPGQGGNFNTEDVVFPNVRINLEVQSDDFFLSDETDNLRLDGTRTGVFTFFADGEGHNDVCRDGSDALAWVGDTIRALELGP